MTRPTIAFMAQSHCVLNFSIQKEYGKIWTRKTAYLDTFHTMSFYNTRTQHFCIRWVRTKWFQVIKYALRNTFYYSFSTYEFLKTESSINWLIFVPTKLKPQRNFRASKSTRNFTQKTNWRRIHWLDRRIVRKQLDIMPTYHYVQNQGKLMMQSRENGQKPQFGQFFWRFRGQISPNCNFSWKTGFIQIEGHI